MDKGFPEIRRRYANLPFKGGMKCDFIPEPCHLPDAFDRKMVMFWFCEKPPRLLDPELVYEPMEVLIEIIMDPLREVRAVGVYRPADVIRREV